MITAEEARQLMSYVKLTLGDIAQLIEKYASSGRDKLSYEFVKNKLSDESVAQICSHLGDFGYVVQYEWDHKIGTLHVSWAPAEKKD